MKFDAKMKKLITKDWGNEFLNLHILKPAQLANRCGPILVGICLDRESNPEVYKPIAHIHNLCTIESDISISLAGYVLNDKGLPIVIKVKNHAVTYKDYAERIKVDYPYTNKSIIDFNDIVIATQKYITGRTFPYQHKPYSDIVTIAAYLNKTEYAFKALESFTTIISKWPEKAFNVIGSAEKWRNGLLEMIKNPDKLHKNVDEEIVKHKLTKLNDNGLTWPEKPLKLWEMPHKFMYE